MFNAPHPIAWHVIKNCSFEWRHPFVYEFDTWVSVGDNYGNFSPKHLANPGQSIEIVLSASGHIIQPNSETGGQASNPHEIEVVNRLNTGAISANLFRSGKLLATKKVVSPGQTAVFRFNPEIYIGAVSEIEEGEELSSAIVSNLTTKISLQSIGSTDILMTGGGEDATPFQFSIDNVVII